MAEEEYFLKDYLSIAPIPLGLVRAVDCRYLSTVEFKGKILDIGCGDGLFAKILFKNRTNLLDTGIDFDSVELRKAKTTTMYKNLIQCSVTQMPLPSCSYDTVFSNSVLEHIPDLDGALAEIGRVMKPGGRFIFTVPSELLSEQMFFSELLKKIGLKSLGAYYADLKNRAWKHYHLYPPKVWIDKLDKQELKTITHKYIHPESITRLCDLLTFSGVISIFWRKLFGRLLLFPGNFRGRFLSSLLKGLYNLEADTGSTIFMVAEKR